VGSDQSIADDRIDQALVLLHQRASSEGVQPARKANRARAASHSHARRAAIDDASLPPNSRPESEILSRIFFILVCERWHVAKSFIFCFTRG
jgi:hypothetical protein